MFSYFYFLCDLMTLLCSCCLQHTYYVTFLLIKRYANIHLIKPPRFTQHLIFAFHTSSYSYRVHIHQRCDDYAFSRQADWPTNRLAHQSAQSITAFSGVQGLSAMPVAFHVNIKLSRSLCLHYKMHSVAHSMRSWKFKKKVKPK